MSMPSVDPGDLTQDEMHGNETVPAALPQACAYCGDDFDEDKLEGRRSEKNADACVGCAQTNGLELTIDESNDLAEQYWSRRYDQ